MISENMLDDLYDCLIYIDEVIGSNELNHNEVEALSKAYYIIKNLYNGYTE